MSDPMNIEVLLAWPRNAELVNLRLPAGSTVQQALEASGLTQKHPDLDFSAFKLGIYGKLCKGDTMLRDRDRVELYRPLIADPKEVRRKRAEEGKVMKKGGGPAEDAA